MATSTLTKPGDVRDWVRSWTSEEKDAVLVELLDEAIRIYGRECLIPITKPNGEPMGHYVPPAAKEEKDKRLPLLTPEQQAITDAALANPSRTFDIEEIFRLA